jgi:hypothetical protein
MELPLGGGCMCGAVRYEISELPLRVYACHCTDCQRITGSAFSLGVVVSAGAFRATGKDRALAPPILGRERSNEEAWDLSGLRCVVVRRSSAEHELSWACQGGPGWNVR